MNNTVNTNKKANAKATAKKNSLKTNKAFIAAISAAVTAVTMTAGLALTVAIVSPAEKTAPQTAVTAPAAQTTVNPAEAAVKPAVKPVVIDNNAAKAAADNNTAKAILNKTQTAEPEKKEAPAAQQTAPVQTAAPAAQQAAPVQTAAPAAQQTAPAQTAAPAAQQAAPAQTAAPAVQQTAPVQTAAPAAEKKEAPKAQKTGTPVIPQGEVNDWKTHDAKDGFPIGTFFNGNSTLNVVKLDDANYRITVTKITGLDTAEVYDINAVANGSKMFYKNGVKNAVVFDADGHVAESSFIDNAHNGTFDASDAGYTWVDTEGTTIFVPWFGY